MSVYQKHLRNLLFVCIVSQLYVYCASTIKVHNSQMKKPRLISVLDLNYPEEAEKRGIEGKVGLYLLVDTTGSVLKTRIASSSHSDILDEAAKDYGKNLKFRPAMQAGKPTAAWITMEINYTITRDSIFQMGSYVKEISGILQSVQLMPIKEKNKLLKKMLNLHKNFVEYALEQNEPDYMPYLRTILLDEVLQEWQPFPDIWPLSFVVYEDFLQRFPQSGLTSLVKKELLSSIEADIEHIEEISPDTIEQAKYKKEFHKKLYNFLQQKYPHLIKNNLKILLIKSHTKNDKNKSGRLL